MGRESRVTSLYISYKTGGTQDEALRISNFDFIFMELFEAIQLKNVLN
jgi:hypothetical protein